jgi:hypothetical protein
VFQVPLITTILKSIELYSDIVVIRRGHPQLPRMIRRWSRQRMVATRDPANANEFFERHPFLAEADETRRDWIT